MATVVDTLQERLVQALQAAGLPAEDRPQVVPATDPRHGDYQTNLAMVLAKTVKQNPRALASQIVQRISFQDMGPEPEIAGPGFINFRLSGKFVGERLRQVALDDRLGVALSANPQTIVIDFSSPNIAKPMHVGHIRSTILGDALARVSRFLGHRVITDNHIGDWGTQFGKIVYGWKNLLGRAALSADPMGELVRIYREAEALSKSDAAVLSACREELVKLQQGDPANLGIWQETVALSTQEFSRIYQMLDIRFDEQLGESYYNSRLPGAVEELLKRGIAEESQGAIVAWDRSLSGDPMILRKSDGGFGYAATDTATLQFRAERWHPDAIWYVVGSPQKLHFQQLFSIARRLGYTVRLEHIAFGSILGEDRKLMRTRSGDSVPLEGLLDEAIVRAATLVREKNPHLSADDQTAIGRVVGIGAVKYAELSQHRLTDYVFAWDKLLSLQGNTAPYLQNAYVRSRSIFRRLNEPFALPEQLTLREEAERALAKRLLQFGEAVPAILDGFRPNVLANYLYELAAEFHGFYEGCPVLGAEGHLRGTRLVLCDVFSRTLKTGLGLLGIEVPERM
jgi:arginyl-tRNA synthetase